MQTTPHLFHAKHLPKLRSPHGLCELYAESVGDDAWPPLSVPACKPHTDRQQPRARTIYNQESGFLTSLLVEHDMMQHGRILKPGHNCWRVEHADRLAFLVDGADYFRAFREAAVQAERSIWIIGWDFDSRCLLVKDPLDRLPNRLGAFLLTLLSCRRKLHIYVLPWDFHMIYAFEREWWPPSRLLSHRRLHFHMDDTHPLGASHHQKVVVIDDAVAFAGGLDFAQCRWDTPEHRPGDPWRTFPDGRPCRPFHDVQVMVDGHAALALGELARERWLRATCSRIAISHSARRRDLWPASVKPDLENVQVGIARTLPQYGSNPEVREVERLYLDAIQAAQRFIYIETQYLTSKAIGAALASRLEEPNGPQILIVLHPSSDGWLEQHTMDVLRGRLLGRLRAADKHGRLGLYYPHLPGLMHQCMSVHSKVLIMDDELARVGSANLSNRSMGFDTECDLAVEASGHSHIRQGIAAFRNRLLAEHLGVAVSTVQESFAQEQSPIAAVENLRCGERTLKIFDGQIPSDLDSLVPDSEIVDPYRPLDPGTVAGCLIPEEIQRPVHLTLIKGALLLLALLTLAALWHWTPLRQWLDIPMLVDHVARFSHHPAAPFAVIGGFLVGGILIAPVTILIAVTVLAFGPLLGFLYSFLGMTLSAVLTYGLGHVLGHHLVERLAGSRLHKLSRRLAQRGLLTMIAVRILPIAPFTVINTVAGASHIRFRDFFLGTIIGELPGLLAVSIFVDQVNETVRNPGPGSFLFLAGVAGIIILGALWLQRRLGRHAEHREP